MARPIRIEFPGALHHVTSRGNAGAAIFRTDRDRVLLLRILAQTVERYHWLCHAYCLMGNHYHLLVETPDANLARGMRQLNGTYTQAFNRRHGRAGHVFQGRYKAILVERDSYLLELARYIVLNPVRAGLAAGPAAYRWSSFRACVGRAPKPDFLFTDWLLRQFAADRKAAQDCYARFVAEGRGAASPWSALRGGVVLGGDRFARAVRRRLTEGAGSVEAPRRQRFIGRPALTALFADRTRLDRARRAERIRQAHVEHGYSQSEIARALGLHYSTVSRILARHAAGSRCGVRS